MGKVLVVNTLVASLFIYTMQVDIDPDDDFYRKFDQMVHNYLWKGKRAKIRLELLKEPKKSAGLNLTDLEKRKAALKIDWLLKIKQIMPTELGALFWDCNLEENDCKRYLSKIENLNKLWKCCTVHWFRLKSKNERTDHENDQILWLNSEIKVKDEVLYHKVVIAAGCVYVTDIIEHNKCISYDKFIDRYGRSINWMQYASLCAAIPCRLMYSKVDKNESMYEKLEKTNKKVNVIYKMLQESEEAPLKEAHRRFCKYVNCEFEEYKRSFQNLYRSTDITKYRNFQYRLLVNTIHTNNRLFYWRIVNIVGYVCKLSHT